MNWDLLIVLLSIILVFDIWVVVWMIRRKRQQREQNALPRSARPLEPR